MSVSHEHFNFWFVEIGADFDQLLKLSNIDLKFFCDRQTAFKVASYD